jgi:outer membrane protein OmpA-like peptidoglycan-associated protein
MNLRIFGLALLAAIAIAMTAGVTITITGNVYYKERFVQADSVMVYLQQEGRNIDSVFIHPATQKFQFKVSPLQTYRLVAVKEGYLNESVLLNRHSDTEFRKYTLTVGKDTGHYEAKGMLEDEEGLVANAYMWVYNTMTHEMLYGRSGSTGEFSFSLKNGYDYQIWAKKAGYLKKVAYVNYCDNKPEKNSKYCLKGFSDVRYEPSGGLAEPALNLTMSMEKIDFTKSYRIDNIYYDLDKWFIRPDAARELNKMVKVMNDNPEISIELSSHTDCRARDKYNLELSQKRAESAVAYLISKGIDSTRMTAKGYGETKLVNRCKDGVKCPEYMHQQNRRTEFRITEVGEWSPEWD